MRTPTFPISEKLLQMCPILTSYEKEILKLRYVNKERVQAVADHFGKSIGTVSPQITRALEKFERWRKSNEKEITAKQQMNEENEEDSGEMAARCYELFQKNKTQVDVVIELRWPPKLVRRFHQQWADMKGILVISAPERDRIYDEINNNESIINGILRLVSYYNALQKYKFPCDICGEELLISGSALNAARKYLMTEGWGHSSCHKNSKS